MNHRGRLQREVIAPFIVLFFGDAAMSRFILHAAPVIQKYIDLVNAYKKAHGKRGLRCDAVTGIEMIEKPPMDYMENLSREEQIRFLKDSGEVMNGILKEWNPDWITTAQVIHFDEFGGKAPHSHRIVIPLSKDKDGILAFNAKAEFNLKFFTFVNKEYPKRMRALGYDIEDCRIYDLMTEVEKEQHQQNKPEYGLESFEYKRRKQQELETTIAERKTAVEDLENKQRELTDQNKKLEERNRQVKSRIMTEEEVKALPKPPKTLGGDYKISPKKYQNLLATAKRVDLAEHNARVLRDKEQKLREKEADLEKYQAEYLAAESAEKDKTFLGAFFLAAMAHKSMVTNAIFRSGNLLAGFSVDFSERGFHGIRDYRKLLEADRKGDETQ